MAIVKKQTIKTNNHLNSFLFVVFQWDDLHFTVNEVSAPHENLFQFQSVLRQPVLEKLAFPKSKFFCLWLKDFRSSAIPSSVLNRSQSSFDFSNVLSFAFLLDSWLVKLERPPDFKAGGLFPFISWEFNGPVFLTSSGILNVIILKLDYTKSVWSR